MDNNRKVGLNEQDAPHKEGQYGNTSDNPNAEENVSMGISQMKDDERQRNNNDSTPTEQNKKPGTDGL